MPHLQQEKILVFVVFAVVAFVEVDAGVLVIYVAVVAAVEIGSVVVVVGIAGAVGGAAVAVGVAVVDDEPVVVVCGPVVGGPVVDGPGVAEGPAEQVGAHYDHLLYVGEALLEVLRSARFGDQVEAERVVVPCVASSQRRSRS